MDENLSENTDKLNVKKPFRVELSGIQVFFGGLGLVLFLSWMFIFGILVGRGLPIVDSKDFSLKAQFFQFLGLGQEVPAPTEDAAETWENPQKRQEAQKKILESLNYYEELAHTDAPPPPGASSNPHAASSSAAPSPKDKAGEQNPKSKAKQQAAPAPHTDGTTAPSQKNAPQPSSKGQDVSESSPEHFTLLIASLKDGESARKLVDQLRAKGYNARLEPLDAGGASWNRVLLGSFPNREGALRFAAEFNRRERLEGLVIREAR